MPVRYIKKQSAIYYLLICFVLISLFFNKLGILDLDIELESLVIVGISSVMYVALIGIITTVPNERILLMAGYIARLIYLYLDVYKNFTLTGGGSDADGFWNNAVERYQGNEVSEYTQYPYIIKGLLHIFGENRLLAQYINILVWLFAVLILCKCFRLFEIEKKSRFIGIACFCFLPQYIILTSTLMRESIIVFLNTFSLYCFLRWFQKQKLSDIIFAEIFVILSMILHSGAIGIGIAYGIAFAIYDKKYKKIRISVKTIIVALIGISGMFIVFLSSYRSAIIAYLPKLNNLFELQRRWFDETGASNYLTAMPYTENIFVFIINTAIRIFYFFVSPVPWEWRGMIDLFAFCIDTLFHSSVIIWGIYIWITRKQNRNLLFFLLLCIFMVGLVFAWGVSNAGTAMRHRCKLIGIEVILLSLCMKRKHYIK